MASSGFYHLPLRVTLILIAKNLSVFSSMLLPKSLRKSRAFSGTVTHMIIVQSFHASLGICPEKHFICQLDLSGVLSGCNK